MHYLTNNKGQRRFIVTQDRDACYPLTSNLYTTSEFKQFDDDDSSTILWGINLMMGLDNDSVFLGTFDSVDQCIREINHILACQDEIYAVRTFDIINEPDPNGICDGLNDYDNHI